MKLQELKEGTELTLQVEWGNNQYEIPTKIVLSMQNRVFIAAFSYNGTALDLSKVKNYSGMVFHLFCNDPADGKRLSWRSIGLEMREVKNKIYYEVTASTFTSESRDDNRRARDRLLIDKPGKIKVIEDEISFRVQIYDISRSGISFRCKKDLTITGLGLIITFEDDVGGHVFPLTIHSRCVRKALKEEEAIYHYGCTIVSMTREIVAYVSLKAMKNQVEARRREAGLPEQQQEAKHVIDLKGMLPSLKKGE
jgi:hypothetical protein